MLRMRPAQSLTIAAVFGLLALGLYLIGPSVNPWVPLTAVVVAVISLAGGIAADRKGAAELAGSRPVRYGLYTLALVSVVLAILVLANLFSRNHHLRWDLTSGGRFTLTDQTVSILDDLPAPVEAVVCFSPASPGSAEARQRFIDLLTEYEYAAGGSLTYREVDPLRDPAEARELGVSSETTVLLCQDRSATVDQATEEALTNGLLRVIRESSRNAYFITGHGGRALAGDDGEGLGLLATALRREGYETAEVNLVREGGVPGDADLLVLAGLRGDLLAGEVRMIREYVEGGGGCLLLLDPPGKDEQPQLDTLLAAFGLRAGRDLVVDPLSQSLVGDYLVPVAMGYSGEHPITAGFTVVSYFPLARTVSAIDAGGEATFTGVTELIFTAPESFAETGFEEVAFDDGVDLPGPLSLAAAVELAAAQAEGGGDPLVARGGRLVVAGDSDFATNAHFTQQGNGNLLLNAVNWLAGDESLISIERPVAGPDTVDITWAESRFILVALVLGYPLVLLALGLVHWRRRRTL